MFDRQGDEPGYNDWTGKLAKGASRDYVFAGFVGSQEFLKLCGKFGITPGTYSSNQYRDQDLKKTEYVNRLFEKLLGRAGDEAGLNNNCRVLLNGGSAQDVVKSIMNSSEYLTHTNKISRERAIQDLFQALFGRGISGDYEYDQYVNNTSLTLSGVAEKLMATDEFKAFCTSYGVPVSAEKPTSGTLTITANGQVISGSTAEILAGIVMGEVGGFNNAEVYKAQAVAAYSWLQFQYSRNVTAPIASYKTPTSAVTSAVKEVAGQLLTYGGKAANTTYFASCAMRTNSAQDIWGTSYPYLQQVESKYDNIASDYQVERTFDQNQMTAWLRGIYDGQRITDFNADLSTWFQILQQDPNKFVRQLRLGLTWYNDALGGLPQSNPIPNTNTWIELMNKQAGSYQFRAPAFDVRYNMNGTWTFTFYGWGHGVGMSQWGAYGYAIKEGWNYQQILAHYYPGTVLQK